MYFFLACDCNPDGSVNHLCDDNGKCTCKENMTGDKCDRADDGFYGFPVPIGRHLLRNISTHLIIDIYVQLTFYVTHSFLRELLNK